VFRVHAVDPGPSHVEQVSVKYCPSAMLIREPRSVAQRRAISGDFHNLSMERPRPYFAPPCPPFRTCQSVDLVDLSHVRVC
jgi:hypothetical protein